jgi:HAD superfamily hydrolase (TIGR01490 family)
MTQIAAFFDVDHTLLTRSSGTLYVKYLYQIGRAGIVDVLRSVFWLLEYKLNLINMEKVTRKALKDVRGMREEELIEICNRWFEEMVKGYIYPEGQELVVNHRREGQIVTIITAATVYLARPLSKFLGIEHFLCTYLEVDHGIFTGNVVEPMCYGEGKIYWAKRFCEERGIDLSQSYFYTDSITDLQLMQLVGHPVAVNPDPLLKREALKRNWKVMNFRPLNP